jgi:hypothetical protein
MICIEFPYATNTCPPSCTPPPNPTASFIPATIKPKHYPHWPALPPRALSYTRLRHWAQWRHPRLASSRPPLLQRTTNGRRRPTTAAATTALIKKKKCGSSSSSSTIARRTLPKWNTRAPLPLSLSSPLTPPSLSLYVTCIDTQAILAHQMRPQDPWPVSGPPRRGAATIHQGRRQVPTSEGETACSGASLAAGAVSRNPGTTSMTIDLVTASEPR